ncbi:hypothetical protein VTO42DRAFT_2769 [Malbranchea cinnamomea]
MVHRGKRLHSIAPRGASPPMQPRPPAVPIHRWPLLEFPQGPTVVKRAPDSGSTCGPDDTTGRCERPSSDSARLTLPIVLAIVIPIAGAIIVFYVLHRRHLRRLRREDAEDKHKSLDFGLDYVPEGVKQKHNRGAEMGMANGEKSSRRGDHGLSMDITMSSPYLLPPGLHGSQESLHSLSRSLPGADDKYHRATAFTPSDNASMRSTPVNRKPPMDDSSSFTASSARHVYGDEMSHGLLGNAQRMSKSPHFVHTSSPPPEDERPVFTETQPTSMSSPQAHGGHASASSQSWEKRISAIEDSAARNEPDGCKDRDYLSHFLESGFQSRDLQNSMTKDILPHGASNTCEPQATELSSTISGPSSSSTTSPPEMHVPSISTHKQSPPRISVTVDDDKSDYGDGGQMAEKPALPQVKVNLAEPENVSSHQRISVAADDIYDQYLEPDMRRLTMGIRPLPPEDPSDNPEQRANRIRSFYKEYFDESKPFQEDYHEGYRREAPQYGDREPLPGPPPFAQPVGRRAMTPPPRMPPRFHPVPRQNGAASALDFAGGRGHRGFGSMSSGTGPRVFSSASGRAPGMAPKKPLSPPPPLHILPTPHKLKDDSMILPIDYAPGAGAKERRAGRSDTPLGGLRPYSPSVPAHVPLASSYDDLCVIPSPHALRKSGTFTALDFAPPPRFRDLDSGSDSGSIRSNRTGISAAQAHHIRSGAYRVSRLPPETVGTKEDITANLKPTWDMHR